MKSLSLLLLLLPPLAGCASHDDKLHKKNSYAEMERQQEADEDHQFFYGRWLNPNATTADPRSVNSPDWMGH